MKLSLVSGVTRPPASTSSLLYDRITRVTAEALLSRNLPWPRCCCLLSNGRRRQATREAHFPAFVNAARLELGEDETKDAKMDPALGYGDR
jgi:hypothetical protein